MAPSLKAASVAAAFIIAAGSSASAQLNGLLNNDIAPTLTFDTDYMGYALSVSPRVGYSDNINLSPDGFEEDEILLSTLLSGNAIFSSNRFTGIVQGDLDVTYLTDLDEVNANQQIAGVGTFTLADNLVYFDVSGSTARQLVGDNARFSRNLNAARNQRVNVHSFALSPYLNRQFEDESAVEVRYRFSQVFVQDDDSVAQGFLNDSRSQEVFVGYDTGRKLDRLNVKLSAYGTRTNEFGAVFAPEFVYEQGTLLSEISYQLTQNFALTGSVGYDEIDSDLSEDIIPTDELSGLNWLAGFNYRPSRRTNILLQYGERFGDDYINGLIDYQINRRVSFQASASRFFQTRAQSVNSQFEVSQRRVLDFADQLRQNDEGASPNGVIQSANLVFNRFGGGAQAIGVGVSDVYQASLIGVFGQTTASASAIYANDDFSFREIETFGGEVNLSHQLSRRSSLYGNVFYRNADTSIDVDGCIATPQLFGFDTTLPEFSADASCNALSQENGVTDILGFTAGGKYQIFRNLAAFAEYSYTTRLSDNDLLKFDENFVQAGIVLDF
ncbi:MAG: hypothetical protein AAF668_02535 [Pseudomonadota bacterium]